MLYIIRCNNNNNNNNKTAKKISTTIKSILYDKNNLT